MEQDTIVKFCIVGQPGVGKTSMLQQYVYHKFDEKVRPTVGCDFSTKIKNNNDGRTTRLQLWDIAGQQRFTAVSKMYLRNAKGCVVVCSADEKNSLNQTQKWLKIVKSGPQGQEDEFKKIPCMLVMNKSDLIGDNPQTFQQKQYLQQFARKNGFCGVEITSAKLNRNIDNLFTRLLDEAISKGIIKNEVNQTSRFHEKSNISLEKPSFQSKKKQGSCC